MFRRLKMDSSQLEIFVTRQKEWISILDQIAALQISPEWVEVFTVICLNRGFRKLDDAQLGQMMNIATVNSPAIAYLARHQGKIVGLHTLEHLSVMISDEPTRLKAVMLIVDKGVKPSRNELDLIIARAKNTPSLFDEVNS